MIKLTYIYHDCFVVENDSDIFVFDYWKDPFTERGELPFFITSSAKEKTLNIFVSHHHKDHYSKHIFEWNNLFKTTRYFLSADTARSCRYILKPDSIYEGPKPNPEDVIILKPGERFKHGTLEVYVYSSTDIGNSYLVRSDNKTIFHAGDLNAWVWDDEELWQDNAECIKTFKAIIESIKKDFTDIDYAMFPVDPRLGKETFTGARIFNGELKIKTFIPMHFCLGENDKEQSDYLKKVWQIPAESCPKSGECVILTSPYSGVVKYS